MKYFRRFALFITIIAVVVAILLTVWGKKVGDLNSSLLAVLELFGLILALAFVCFIFYQIIRYYFSPQFIFEGFSNEGDLLTNEQKPLQFSKLAWEELANQFQALVQKWGPNANGSEGDQFLKVDPDMQHNVFLEKIFIPLSEKNFIGAAGTTVIDRVKVAEVKGPENFVILMSIIGFIGSIIPQPIIRIVGHLQRQGYPSDKLGITLEFIDDKRPFNFVIHSFWEDESATSSLGLQQRYRKLLHPTLRWLILECYRRKEEAQISRRDFNFYVRHKKWSETKQEKEAQLLYTLGSLCYAITDEFESPQAKVKEFFLQLAINYSLQSSKMKSDWYLPYLFRANVHGYKMLLTRLQSPERSEFLRKALDVYNLALDCKEAKGNEPKENIENRYRIIVARASVELRSGINRLIDKAYRELEDTRNELDPADFDPERSDCAIFLYDLASWYAVANDMLIPQFENENFGMKAWRYLAYSLVRSQSKWKQAEEDIIFKVLRFERNLEILKEELRKKLNCNPHLAKARGATFKDEIETVLEKIDKSLIQSAS